MEQQQQTNGEVAKTDQPAPLSLAKMAPEGIDGRAWVKLLKDQLLASKTREPSDAELLYFATVCRQSGLDPARKEIYGIYRGGKLTIQTSIDGLRAVAERTGKFAGSDEPMFEYEKEGDKNPRKATVTVKKVVGGVIVGTTRSALWSEYYGSTSNQIVKQMPTVMLAKCAEAQALRAAFPNLGQLYVEEEMVQANKVQPVVVDRAAVKDDMAAAKANLLGSGKDDTNGTS